VAAIEQAQRDGVVTGDIPAATLLNQVQALAVGDVIGHGVGIDDADRADLVTAVTRLVRP
jgi:hypothetical protein